MTPLWRRAFDVMERPITAVSESWVQTESFMDLTAVAFRVQRRMLGEVHQATDRWLEFWGWPSRADVLRLSNQVATLERQVREFRAQAEQRERPLLNGRQSRSRPRARQRSGRDRGSAARASDGSGS
jgi:hypothetical protein